MLGVYDYTVILTYISLWISIGGMMLSLNGHLDLAVLCLALSGLCDMFDGKIARTKKDRTEIEKRFGIQIDSLCDIVCFGVGPAIICYCMGMNGIVGVLILMSDRLTAGGIHTTIRASRGEDIQAACGLLSTAEAMRRAEQRRSQDHDTAEGDTHRPTTKQTTER